MDISRYWSLYLFLFYDLYIGRFIFLWMRTLFYIGRIKICLLLYTLILNINIYLYFLLNMF